MSDDWGKGKKRRTGRKRRDFWRAWQEERRRFWEEQDTSDQEVDSGFPHPPFPHRMMARHWREFFHDFMGTWPENHWALGGRRFSPWRQGMDAFNPLLAGLMSMGGGLLPLYVLHLLSQKPRYGNEMMDLITERTSGQWVANPGAIYPLMTMLEENDLVTGKWEDPRKRTVRIYQLTDAGEQELARLKAIVTPKLREAIAILQRLAQDLNGHGEEYL